MVIKYHLEHSRPSVHGEILLIYLLGKKGSFWLEVKNPMYVIEQSNLENLF